MKVKSKSKKFDDLRDWQKQFSKYYEVKNLAENNFLGINIPTGFGKTLIGLLIAKNSIDNNKTCAIITQTRALVEKIKNEADDLGIENVIIPTNQEIHDNPSLKNIRSINEKKYSHAEAVRISTYDMELYTGLKPAEVLIIDDADMFVNNIQRKSSIILSRELYPDVYEDLIKNINPRNYDGFDDVIKKKTFENHFIFINANESILIQEKFIKLIQDLKERTKQNIKSGDDLYFKLFWDANENLKDYFPLYFTFISSAQIVFQLLFPDPIQIEEISKSQIILMSATLGQATNIQQEFGITENITIVNLSDLGISKETMGNRIIFPIDIDESMDTQDYIVNSTKFANEFQKILYMVYTNKEADGLKQELLKISKNTFIYKNQNDIDNFLKNMKSYLISVGRYIGMDIPTPDPPLTPCDITILTKIPYHVSPLDMFYEEICGRVELLYDIIARRLVQSFGRCNRDDNSYGVYFIIDPELNHIFRRNLKYSALFPKEIYEQLNLGFENGNGGDILSSIECAKKFLKKESLKAKIPKRPDFKSKILPIIQKIFPNELNAWNAYILHNFNRALTIIDEILHDISTITDESHEIRDYFAWLYYFKCFILEGYFNSTKDPKIWDLLKNSQNDLSLISSKKIFNLYTHQMRSDPESMKKEVFSPKSDSIAEIFLNWSKNPLELFNNVWDTPYFQENQKGIISSLEIFGQGKYEDAVDTIIPKFETILRAIYEEKKGLDPKATLNDFIDYFRSQKLICKNTQNHFQHIPNNFIDLRNEILHGLKTVSNPTEALTNFLSITNGIKYIINDLYFSEMINLIKGEDIKLKTRIPSIKMFPSPKLEETVRKKWLESEKEFNPDPSLRIDPLIYKGKILLKDTKKSEFESIDISLDFNDTI